MHQSGEAEKCRHRILRNSVKKRNKIEVKYRMIWSKYKVQFSNYANPRTCQASNNRLKKKQIRSEKPISNVCGEILKMFDFLISRTREPPNFPAKHGSQTCSFLLG